MNQPKSLKVILLCSTLFVLLGLLSYLLIEWNRPNYVGDPRRDYRLNPYDFNDATEDCLKQAKKEYQGRLRHSFVDMHSSRFEEKGGYYLIVVQGTMTDNSQQARYAYCQIYPKTQELVYTYTNKPKGMAGFFESFTGKPED